MKRVCITGVGCVSPYGRGATALWSGLAAGRSALAPVTAFTPPPGGCTVAGELRDYAPRDDIDPAAAAVMDRRQLFAADAAIQALEHADIPLNAETVSQIGVAVATELPEATTTVAAQVARTAGVAGPVVALSAGAVGGLMAIGEAAEWVRREDCSIAVAGGAEAPVTPDAFAHFGRMLTKNADPAAAVRPYDAARDGFALSEGAAIVVLEDEDVAVRRGAHILAYVDGYGASFSRAAVADPRANPFDAARAMQMALLKWDVTLQGEIDVVFGTAGGGDIDIIEAQAIKRVWGPNVDRLWVTAIKGSLGHTLGASGPFAVIAAMHCLQAGLMPPTLNLETLDPECAGVDVVTGEVRRLHGTKALVNAFGFGHNASLVLSRP